MEYLNLGGFFVIAEQVHKHDSQITFCAYKVFAWDEAQHQYTFCLFDAFRDSSCMPANGVWQGTIEGAVAAARKYNKYITADMIGVHDRGKRAAELEKMGVNYLEIHCGLDEQAHGLCSLNELKTIREMVKIPLSIAGGIKEDTIQQVEAAGANVAAVGAAIYGAKSPKEAARRIREKIGSKH